MQKKKTITLTYIYIFYVLNGRIGVIYDWEKYNFDQKYFLHDFFHLMYLEQTTIWREPIKNIKAHQVLNNQNRSRLKKNSKNLKGSPGPPKHHKIYIHFEFVEKKIEHYQKIYEKILEITKMIMNVINISLMNDIDRIS